MADLKAVKKKVATTKGKTITMTAPTAEARAQLEALGFKIKNTKGKNVIITVPTGARRRPSTRSRARSTPCTASPSPSRHVTFVTTAPRAALAPTPQLRGKADGGIVSSTPTAACGRTTSRRSRQGKLARVGGGRGGRRGLHPPQPNQAVPGSRQIAAETVKRLGGRPGSPTAASPASPTRRPGGRCWAARRTRSSATTRRSRTSRRPGTTSTRRSRTRRRPPTTSRPPRRTSPRSARPPHGRPAAGGEERVDKAKSAKRSADDRSARSGRRQRRRQGTRAEEGRQRAQDLQPEGL
jgi:hypothetical protein